jgi:hypothetical protein
MMIMKMNKSAQGIMDYALVIAAVAAALLTMQVYFKRGVQSVVKVSVDQLGGFNSGISPEEVQKMAIHHELDPKYGALQSYHTQITTDQSATVTVPVNGNGTRRVAINKWKDTVKDIEEGGRKGKVFYQELNY